MTNNKFLFLAVSIPLLVLLPLTHANAAVTPEVHKCIHKSILGTLGLAAMAAAMNSTSNGNTSFNASYTRGYNMAAAITALTDNATNDVEKCLK